MMHQLVPAAGASPSIHCWGDSLTEGTSGMAGRYDLAWPALLANMFSPVRAVVNYGVGGETAAQIATRQLAYLISNNVINVIWAGRNSVLSLSAATVLATVQTMTAPVVGGRFIVMDVPYKSDGTEDADDADGITIKAFNDLLASTYGSKCLVISTTLGRDNSLRGDGLHPNAAGHAVIAPVVYAKIVAMEAAAWA